MVNVIDRFMEVACFDFTACTIDKGTKPFLAMNIVTGMLFYPFSTPQKL